jgi:hypothetical protein
MHHSHGGLGGVRDRRGRFGYDGEVFGNDGGPGHGDGCDGG